jgi:hypothetical protein
MYNVALLQNTNRNSQSHGLAVLKKVCYGSRIYAAELYPKVWLRPVFSSPNSGYKNEDIDVRQQWFAQFMKYQNISKISNALEKRKDIDDFSTGKLYLH